MWSVFATGPEAGLSYCSGTARAYGVAENAWQRGVSKWPMECDGSVGMRLSQEELTLLLGGIDLKQTKARNWYRKTVFESEKIEKEASN